jgi:hypothetical protein
MQALGNVMQHLTRWDFYFTFLVAVYVLLKMTNNLPAVESIRRLMSALDDRGGNIVVLVALTVWFFAQAIYMFYFAINMIGSGKIDGKDAVLLMGLQFVTGVAFGGSFGALLKTLNGQVSTSPPSPNFIPGSDVSRTHTETIHEETVPGKAAAPVVVPPVKTSVVISPAVVAPPPPPPAPPPLSEKK